MSSERAKLKVFSNELIVDPKRLPFCDKSLPTHLVPHGVTLSKQAQKEAERVAFHVVRATKYPQGELEGIRERDRKVFEYLGEVRRQLETTQFPLITASRSGHEKFDKRTVVLSRAHLTQMLALEEQPDFDSFGIDLAQMLTFDSVRSLCSTGATGRMVARSNLLRKAHELAAPVLRKILKLEPKFKSTIETLFAHPECFKGKPITTFHYAAGNALARHLIDHGISDVPVVMWLSDPHVHKNYLDYSDQSFVYYFTFDQKTADELIIKHKVPKERVFVAGFPISPRLETKKSEDEIKQEFAPMYNEGGQIRKLRVAVLTGGLGGNQDEILEIARGLKYKTQQGLFYCGTNHDLMTKLLAAFQEQNITPRVVNANEVGELELRQDDQVVIVVGDQLDENLVGLSYQVLNAAQIVCTKPSGDFGIEALMANKLVVSLAEWGRHEGNIKEILGRAGALLSPRDLLSLGDFLDDLFWTPANDQDLTCYDKRGVKRACNALGEKAVLLSRNLASSSPFNFNWAENVRVKLAEIGRNHSSSS